MNRILLLALLALLVGCRSADLLPASQYEEDLREWNEAGHRSRAAWLEISPDARFPNPNPEPDKRRYDLRGTPWEEPRPWIQFGQR